MTQVDYAIPSAESATLGKDAIIVAKQKNDAYRRYRLLAFSQSILINHDVKAMRSDGVHRTRLCHAVRAHQAEKISVNVPVNPDSKTASIAGVQTCGCVHSCIVCARRKALEKSLEIRHILEYMRSHGFVPFMLTLTGAHTHTMTLDWFKAQFKLAWRKFSQHRRWRDLKDTLGIKHSIKANEVTHGVNGWHYHSHGILFVPVDTLNSIDDKSMAGWCADLETLWLECLSNAGLSGKRGVALHVSGDQKTNNDYLVKLGLDTQKSNIDHELSGAHNKSSSGRNIWQILKSAYEGDHESELLYVEYVRSMTGDNWITYSHGLADLVNLDALQDVKLDDHEEQQTLIEIDDELYEPVRKLRLYADLLEVSAKSRNAEVVHKWLTGVHRRYMSEFVQQDVARRRAQLHALEQRMVEFLNSPMRKRDPIYEPTHYLLMRARIAQLKASLDMSH